MNFDAQIPQTSSGLLLLLLIFLQHNLRGWPAVTRWRNFEIQRLLHRPIWLLGRRVWVCPLKSASFDRPFKKDFPFQTTNTEVVKQFAGRFSLACAHTHSSLSCTCPDNNSLLYLMEKNYTLLKTQGVTQTEVWCRTVWSCWYKAVFPTINK